MSQVDNSLEPKWYVVHTYSGYENKVKTDLEKTIKNRELEDYFFDIIVPMEEQIEIKEVNVDYSVNDSVKILDGALRDFVGTVTEINKEKHKVKVLVSMFGRETPVELEFSQVEKI